MGYLEKIRQGAKAASYELGVASTKEKDEALLAMAQELINYTKEILEANKIDLRNAEINGTSKSMLDRLALNEDRVMEMANGLRKIANLQDPVGELVSMWQRPNGLQIGKKRVPIGVIGIIYESRPNVTCDAAGLCLKSGNVSILRGGSDAINSNKAIMTALTKGIQRTGLPRECV